MASVQLTLVVLVALASFSAVHSGIGLTPWQFFVGNGEDLDRVIPIAFQPDEGMKLRKKFEKKYGPRGEKLVSSFGQGLDLEAFHALT